MANDEDGHDVRAVKVLVDTNVAIDSLNDRKPWSDEAQPLWQSRDEGRADLYLPASVLTDIFYILRKPLGNVAAKHAVERCVATCGVLPIDDVVIQRALALPGVDFEDNVQIACSQIYSIDLIVTRNPDVFAQGLTVPVVDPGDIERYLPPSHAT